MKVSRTQVLLTASAVVAFMLVAGGCKKAVTGHSDTREVLGTKVTIIVYDRQHEAKTLSSIFDEVFGLMADWEHRTLRPGADNQILHISDGAGEQSITTDNDVFQMLMKGIRLYDNSAGVFDIRYGPMLDAWEAPGMQVVPPAEQLDTLRSYVAEGGMFVAGNGILLAKPGMRFDVRELAEGYVFDLVAARLAERGVRTAAIHSPFVWRFMGDAPDRRGFPVTIPHPVSGDSAYATVWAPVGGVAYAAPAKNRFEANGKSYHLFIDPRSGMPANRLLGALVHSADAATAQALAYAVFVHGSADSLDVNGRKAVAGVITISEAGTAPQLQTDGTLSERVDLRK